MKATDQPDTFSIRTTEIVVEGYKLLIWGYRDASGLLWTGTAQGATDAARQAAAFGYHEGRSLTLYSY